MCVKKPQLNQLPIGFRLTLCFFVIILLMLLGNAVLQWQFELIQDQSRLLSSVDQKFVLVLQAQINLMSFYERLDALSHSQDTARFLSEAEQLRSALIDDNRNIRKALDNLPHEVQKDPTLLSALVAVQDALPAQLDAVIGLAKSGDWAAVRSRLANQVRPLESRTSALVGNINRQAGDQRAQALSTIGQAQQRIRLIVPITATLTILFAALLGLAVTRSITEPLRSLMHSSSALGQADFQHRVPIVGKDEFAALGQVFNQTARTLRDLYEALSTREAYLAQAQRLSHTGSFGWNLSNGELIWSEETFRIFEYSQTIRPTLDAVLQRTHPDDVPLVRGLIERVSNQKTDWDLEYRLLMPDGTVKYVRAVAQSVTDSSGELRFVGAVIDLTARKLAEDSLRQTQAILAKATRVASLGEMTASIAHEVNQPLAAVVANAQAALRWLAFQPPDTDKVRESLEDVVDDAENAAAVVRRVRSLFKGAALEKTLVNLNDLISEVLRLIREETSKRNVIVHTNLDPDLPSVAGDRLQLQHLLLNLLTNGIEAMESTTDRPKKLSIASRRDGAAAVQVDVRDHGTGIREPDKVFDAFFTTKELGLGMGLAICRSIVQVHEGRLWVASTDESGTTISFAIPFGERAA